MCMHAHAHIYTHAQISVHLHMHDTHTHAHTHTHTHTQSCYVDTYTATYTHTHTYTCTRTIHTCISGPEVAISLMVYAQSSSSGLLGPLPIALLNGVPLIVVHTPAVVQCRICLHQQESTLGKDTHIHTHAQIRVQLHTHAHTHTHARIHTVYTCIS